MVENIKGFVEDYPCKCSGGDMCYVVRYPNGEVHLSYTTRVKVDTALQELRDGLK